MPQLVHDQGHGALLVFREGQPVDRRGEDRLALPLAAGRVEPGEPDRLDFASLVGILAAEKADNAVTLDLLVQLLVAAPARPEVVERVGRARRGGVEVPELAGPTVDVNLDLEEYPGLEFCPRAPGSACGRGSRGGYSPWRG